MIGKSSASLSSSLLARKGHARPAMRPQGFVGLTPHSVQDDLGWNDMGDDVASAAPITPVAAPVAAPAPAPAEKPPVLRQIEALDEKFSVAAPQLPPAETAKPEPTAEPAPAPVAAPAPVRAAPALKLEKTKAAFTLRLDAERHLRLRLASAVSRRSAQQLVTAALDAFLETQGEVEALARQVAPAGEDKASGK